MRIRQISNFPIKFLLMLMGAMPFGSISACKLEADEEEEDREYDVDLDRSLKIRLLPSEIEDCGDRDHDEQRLHEGGEVDENVDI